MKIGRALYIANRFESYCKSLSILLDVKSSVNKRDLSLGDDDQLKEFMNKILKLSLIISENYKYLLKKRGFMIKM